MADIDLHVLSYEDVTDYKYHPLPLSFSIDKPEGTFYKDKYGNDYIFSTSVYELENSDKTYSGGTVGHTQIIYTMLEGFEDYYIKPVII